MFNKAIGAKKLFKGFEGDFWIAGGWAIDLFLGHKTREHKDIEIAIPRHDHALLKGLKNISHIDYIEGGRIKSWKGERLVLPIHEMNCHFETGEIIEVLLNEFDKDYWLYRRNLNIKMPKEKLLVQAGSHLPIEIALLFKSQHLRDIDQKDFMKAIKIMKRDQKLWLYKALVTNSPKHPWLPLLH